MQRKNKALRCFPAFRHFDHLLSKEHYYVRSTVVTLTEIQTTYYQKSTNMYDPQLTLLQKFRNTGSIVEFKKMNTSDAPCPCLYYVLHLWICGQPNKSDQSPIPAKSTEYSPLDLFVAQPREAAEPEQGSLCGLEAVREEGLHGSRQVSSL